jgi:hypothetical protein
MNIYDPGVQLSVCRAFLCGESIYKCFPHTRKLVFHIKKSCEKSAMLKHTKFHEISIFELIHGFFK